MDEDTKLDPNRSEAEAAQEGARAAQPFLDKAITYNRDQALIDDLQRLTAYPDPAYLAGFVNGLGPAGIAKYLRGGDEITYYVRAILRRAADTNPVILIHVFHEDVRKADPRTFAEFQDAYPEAARAAAAPKS